MGIHPGRAESWEACDALGKVALRSRRRGLLVALPGRTRRSVRKRAEKLTEGDRIDVWPGESRVLYALKQ